MVLGRLKQFVELWRLYSNIDDQNFPPNARWLLIAGQGMEQDIELGGSPILATHTLQKRLWDKCFGAIVISATLTALNQFNRFNTHSGVPRESEYLRILSPFDFQNNGLLVVPNIENEPNHFEQHTAEIVKYLNKNVNTAKGSLLLGLASFAEGVDLPGDYLTCIFIVKIPFSVPDNPVETTLAE